MKKKDKFDLLNLLKDLKKNKCSSNISTLNSEKNKLEKIKTDLKEMMSSSSFQQGQVFSGASMQLTSNFRKNLQDKISISENRKQYLKREIQTYMKEIGKINKQKEKIKEKKKEILVLNEKLNELKQDFNFKTKNF